MMDIAILDICAFTNLGSKRDVAVVGGIVDAFPIAVDTFRPAEVGVAIYLVRHQAAKFAAGAKMNKGCRRKANQLHDSI